MSTVECFGVEQVEDRMKRIRMSILTLGMVLGFAAAAKYGPVRIDPLFQENAPARIIGSSNIELRYAVFAEAMASSGHLATAEAGNKIENAMGNHARNNAAAPRGDRS